MASDDDGVHQITAKVLASLQGCDEPRMRELSEAVVRHLHALLLEVQPSDAEWRAAIDFLTRVGGMCRDDRQEFILLSDALGASMLVDAINHPAHGNETEHTVLGPFFIDGSARCPNGADLAGGSSGTPMFFSGRVLDSVGRGVAGALIETWQADSDGRYDVQMGDDRRLRATLEALDDGRFSFWSVVPSSYPLPADGPVGEMLAAQRRHPFRPAHVHFRVTAAGFEELVTHVFVAGDPYLASDVVFGVKESLVRPLVLDAGGVAPDGRAMETPWARMSYDFVLGAVPSER